jgi:tRNA (guanine37-N1)-methyltransferase
MHFSVLTIFPELLGSPLEEGIIRRARKDNRIEVQCTDIRDFADDKHQTTDDRPFGGGEGMVLKPEPLVRALQHVRQNRTGTARVILLSPQGTVFDQAIARELSGVEHLILVCGRYEGVDERFTRNHVDLELSLGDYILSGGELGALVVIDTVTRLIPGVLGCSASAENDTFSRNLLKHPQYTRPRTFEGIEVPGELLSGDHERIDAFRFVESVRRTALRRPDLLSKVRFSQAERDNLRKHGLWDEIAALSGGGSGR